MSNLETCTSQLKVEKAVLGVQLDAEGVQLNDPKDEEAISCHAKSIDNLDIVEESSDINKDLLEENINCNSLIGTKKETPLVIDEDNIQDEELDHEVDEEEIKGSTDNFNEINDTVS